MKISKLLWIACSIAGAIFFIVVLFVVLLSALASYIPIPIPGASDYTTKLPNGYYLMRQYAGSSMIFKKTKDGWIDPTTEVGPSQYGILMAVSGDYIVGNLDTEEKYSNVPEIPDRYFIIDTSTDTVMKEMSFEMYEKKMRELGFEEFPNLIRPNKLTRFVD